MCTTLIRRNTLSCLSKSGESSKYRAKRINRMRLRDLVPELLDSYSGVIFALGQQRRGALTAHQHAWASRGRRTQRINEDGIHRFLEEQFVGPIVDHELRQHV